jgi:cytochrome c oxidase subunit I
MQRAIRQRRPRIETVQEDDRQWQRRQVTCSSILAIGYLLPLIYLLGSLRWGKLAGPNPWDATGLEWQTSSPPPTDNFLTQPVVTSRPYDYPTGPA